MSTNAKATTTRNERTLAIWLLTCCAILAALVMVGGATRLTGSGLSIVEWRPVTGIVPPLSERAWRAELDKYRQSPEFRKVNPDITLAGFRTIYLFEYVHRLLARLLGMAFGVPLLWFWLRGRIPGRLRGPLLGLLALGAAQGYMGWYMVQSGLVDIPRVSPYRLAAHLTLALLIYSGMFWLALGLLRPRGDSSGAPSSGAPASNAPSPRTARAFRILLALVAITIFMGAFVAGLRAGRVFNTFPLMAGQWIVPGFLAMEPAWVNFFENPGTVQFLHRWLALATLAFTVALWFNGRHHTHGAAHRALQLLLATVLLQMGLGIATLLLYVPVWLATVHQGGAVLVLSAVLVLGRSVR